MALFDRFRRYTRPTQPSTKPTEAPPVEEQQPKRPPTPEPRKPEGVDNKPTESPPPASAPPKQAEPPAGNADLNRLLDTMGQIGDIIGEPQEEATESDDLTLEVSMADAIRLLPSKYRSATRPSEEERNRSIRIVITEGMKQLARGQCRITLGALTTSIPQRFVSEDAADNLEQSVSLPLPMVVKALPPDLLKRHLKTPEREVGLDFVPDPFAKAGKAPGPKSALTPTPAPTPETKTPEPEDRPAAAPVAEPVEPGPAPAPEPITPRPEPVPPIPPRPEPVLPTTPQPEPVPSIPPRPEPVPSIPPPIPATPAMASVAPPKPGGVHADAPVIMVNGIDLNRASARDLVKRLHGVGPVAAERIMLMRPLRSVYDLSKIEGIGPRMFFRITGEHVPPTGAVAEIIEQILGPTDQPLPSLREIAQRIAATPGVHGCLLSHAEGHILAAAAANRSHRSFGAIAPQIMKSLDKYMDLLKTERPHGLTLFVEPRPLFITRSDNVFLIVSVPRTRFSMRRISVLENVVAELVRRLHIHRPGVREQSV